MPSTDRAAAFAEQAKARDWNQILAPWLFAEKGLADLRGLIEAHGVENVDLAVRDFIARSKADRRISRGHVRSWHFFKPYCEQIAKENAPCAE
jgi:hypothetical protein